jgi:hypothetical protein
MLAEHVLAFVGAVNRAPLSPSERARCYGRLVRWITSHLPGMRLDDPRARAVEVDRSTATPDSQTE